MCRGRYARLALLRRGAGAASSESGSAFRFPRAAFAVGVFTRDGRVLTVVGAGLAMTRAAARPLPFFVTPVSSRAEALPLPLGSMGITSTAVVVDPGLISRESVTSCVGRLMIRGDDMAGPDGGVASVGVLSEEIVRESSGVEAMGCAT